MLLASHRGQLPPVLAISQVGTGSVPTGVVVEFERPAFEDAHVRSSDFLVADISVRSPQNLTILLLITTILIMFILVFHFL